VERQGRSGEGGGRTAPLARPAPAPLPSPLRRCSFSLSLPPGAACPSSVRCPFPVRPPLLGAGGEPSSILSPALIHPFPLVRSFPSLGRSALGARTAAGAGGALAGARTLRITVARETWRLFALCSRTHSNTCPPPRRRRRHALTAPVRRGAGAVRALALG
jgi:hypothetical protein